MSEKRKRSNVISFRVTADEKEAIDRVCRMRGCSRDTLIWRAVFMGETAGNKIIPREVPSV